jgi:EmrB/QacA subfamily drug resistance transporter
MTGVAQILTDSGVALAESKSKPATAGGSVLVASSVGSCLVFMSGALINVSLASIGRDLNLTPFQLQWIVNAEILPLAALTLVSGALGDRFGLKRMFLIGILLFGLGALASSLAPTWSTLLGARFAAGLGAALVLPNGLSILGQAFPADARARAVGLWSAAAAVASAIAPAIGGAIIDHGSWRVGFLVLVPVTAIALIFAILWVPATAPSKKASIDPAGAVLSAISLGAIGWGLTNLTNGAGVSAQVVIMPVIAAVSLIILIVVERRRGDRAMLPPALFMSRSVIGANLFTLFLYGPFTVMLTLVPFIMIRGAHFATVVAGMALIPLQFMIMVISPLAGMLCKRYGRRPPLFAGGLLAAVGCAAALRIDDQSQYWLDIFPAVFLLAIGMSLALAPLTTLVLTSVDADRAGTASGVNSAVSRAGSLIAIALLGGVLRQDGEGLIHGFHLAVIAAAVSCLLSVLAALIIEPGPHVDWVPFDEA